jgi:hypothetical protein
VSLGLATSCTQAQACTAANAPNGASCNAAQARSVGARIFPATEAGREEFVIFQITVPEFNRMREKIAQRHQELLCVFWGTANQTQKDAICTAASLPAGCLLCSN